VTLHKSLYPKFQRGDEANPQNPGQASKKEASGQPVIDEMPSLGVFGECCPDGGHIELGDEGCAPKASWTIFHLLPDIFRGDAKLSGGLLQHLSSERRRV